MKDAVKENFTNLTFYYLFSCHKGSKSCTRTREDILPTSPKMHLTPVIMAYTFPISSWILVSELCLLWWNTVKLNASCSFKWTPATQTKKDPGLNPHVSYRWSTGPVVCLIEDGQYLSFSIYGWWYLSNCTLTLMTGEEDGRTKRREGEKRKKEESLGIRNYQEGRRKRLKIDDLY